MSLTARVLKHKDSEEEESKGAESLVLPAIQADIQEGQGGCTWEQGLDQRQDTRAAPMAPEEQGPPTSDHHTLAMGPHDHHRTVELGMISVPQYPAPWLYPAPHD